VHHGILKRKSLFNQTMKIYMNKTKSHIVPAGEPKDELGILIK
jgi:hypothetical protein